MTYETVAAISQTAALLIFVTLFVLVLAYTLWPANRKAFEEAARMPIETGEQDLSEGSRT